MKNIVSFLLLVFANLSFAQTLQKKRERIFDKAQFEIFCQTIKYVSENGKNSWYPKTICESGNYNINNIYKYLGHKEQIAGGKGNAPSLYIVLKAAKGGWGVNGKDIAKDSLAIATIIKNLKTELKKLSNNYAKNFDILLPELNKILTDAVKEAKKAEEETSISGTNDDDNEIADQNNDLGEDRPEINQNENPRKENQLDALGTYETGEKDIITRLEKLEAQNSLQYWIFGLICFIVVLLIIILSNI